jgi:hypothetical protein
MLFLGKVTVIGAGSGIIAGYMIAWLLFWFCTGQTVSNTETAVIYGLSFIAGALIGALFAAGSVIGDIFCYAALHGSD